MGHYLIVEWCQHHMKWFFMNWLSVLHNHSFTYAKKCYNFTTKWEATEDIKEIRISDSPEPGRGQ